MSSLVLLLSFNYDWRVLQIVTVQLSSSKPFLTLVHLADMQLAVTVGKRVTPLLNQ